MACFQSQRNAPRLWEEFRYETREGWSRARRMITKAEHREEGSSSRFVVASLSPEVWEARRLQEDLQGARGEMEN